MRKLAGEIGKYLERKEFIILTGARQTGKTSVLEHMGDILRKENNSVFEITLEDPEVLKALNQHPKNIFEYATIAKGKKSFVLIDEIQYLQNPTNFLKYLYDKHNKELKILATGSSAFNIDEKFKDSLVGRKLLFEMHPLDFDEFLIFKNTDQQLLSELETIRTNSNYKSLRRNELELLFEEYLTFGGYPAVVLANDSNTKLKLLKELVNTYIKRDILEAGIDKSDIFFAMLKILASQTGQLLNTNELSKTLKISTTAVGNYLYIMQKCFHICLLKPYHTNIQKEITKMPKVYFNDIGLRNMLINQFGRINERLDKGELIENYVFSVLRNIHETDNLYFWRTADGNEVDFVIEGQAEKHFSIEVKFDFDRFNASKYKKFTTLYPQLPLSCMSYYAPINTNSLLAMAQLQFK